MWLEEAAEKIIAAALAAADPVECMRRALSADATRESIGRANRIFVLGAGKASATMAQAVEEQLGDRITSGWVNTKYGHGLDLRYIRCHECGHPIPDQAGVEGARCIAEIASSAKDGDLVICLVSGGASALMPLPIDGISLEEKQQTTRFLLASGATIQEMNAVRKHLSAIKGGQLARLAAPARVHSFVLSDVIGDDLATIGSGPTAPDPSTFATAREALHRRGIWHQLPANVRCVFETRRPETPKPGDPLFDAVENQIIASNRQALAAAQHKARNLFFQTVLLSSGIAGETRDIAGMHAAVLKEICTSGNPLRRPACIISGGETTVTIRGPGVGGRNQEFTLAAALEIQGLENVLVMSVGTDGTDGPTNAAGARADGTTVARAEALGFEPQTHLDANDAYPLFAGLGDLVITGPTRTNVMDIHLLLAG